MPFIVEMMLMFLRAPEVPGPEDDLGEPGVQREGGHGLARVGEAVGGVHGAKEAELPEGASHGVQGGAVQEVEPGGKQLRLFLQ